jgi:hypothetical protein
MTLQSAIDAELPFLRSEAEARMTSRAAIMRKTGGTTTVDGLEVPEWATVYADTPFRLGGAQRGGSGTQTVTVGGVSTQVALRVGNLPADTSDLHDNDFIEITAGENVGVVLRIVEASWQDQATARRVPVVSEARPEEWA